MVIPESKVNQHDVLSGRGSQNVRHIGNVSFRLLIEARLEAYTGSASRGIKTSKVFDAVQTVYKAGGRFLKNTASGWSELDEKEARKKVGHAFRDAARDRGAGGCKLYSTTSPHYFFHEMATFEEILAAVSNRSSHSAPQAAQHDKLQQGKEGGHQIVEGGQSPAASIFSDLFESSQQLDVLTTGNRPLQDLSLGFGSDSEDASIHQQVERGALSMSPLHVHIAYPPAEDNAHDMIRRCTPMKNVHAPYNLSDSLKFPSLLETPQAGENRQQQEREIQVDAATDLRRHQLQLWDSSVQKTYVTPSTEGDQIISHHHREPQDQTNPLCRTGHSQQIQIQESGEDWQQQSTTIQSRNSNRQNRTCWPADRIKLKASEKVHQDQQRHCNSTNRDQPCSVDFMQQIRLQEASDEGHQQQQHQQGVTQELSEQQNRTCWPDCSPQSKLLSSEYEQLRQRAQQKNQTYWPGSHHYIHLPASLDCTDSRLPLQRLSKQTCHLDAPQLDLFSTLEDYQPAAKERSNQQNPKLCPDPGQTIILPVSNMGYERTSCQVPGRQHNNEVRWSSSMQTISLQGQHECQLLLNAMLNVNALPQENDQPLTMRVVDKEHSDALPSRHRLHRDSCRPSISKEAIQQQKKAQQSSTQSLFPKLNASPPIPYVHVYADNSNGCSSPKVKDDPSRFRLHEVPLNYVQPNKHSSADTPCSLESQKIADFFTSCAFKASAIIQPTYQVSGKSSPGSCRCSKEQGPQKEFPFYQNGTQNVAIDNMLGVPIKFVRTEESLNFNQHGNVCPASISELDNTSNDGSFLLSPLSPLHSSGMNEGELSPLSLKHPWKGSIHHQSLPSPLSLSCGSLDGVDVEGQQHAGNDGAADVLRKAMACLGKSLDSDDDNELLRELF